MFRKWSSYSMVTAISFHQTRGVAFFSWRFYIVGWITLFMQVALRKQLRNRFISHYQLSSGKTLLLFFSVKLFIVVCITFLLHERTSRISSYGGGQRGNDFWRFIRLVPKAFFVRISCSSYSMITVISFHQTRGVAFFSWRFYIISLITLFMQVALQKHLRNRFIRWEGWGRYQLSSDKTPMLFSVLGFLLWFALYFGATRFAKAPKESSRRGRRFRKLQRTEVTLISKESSWRVD